MGTRVTVPNQLGGACIQVLLGTSNGLPERRWHRVVEHANAAAWPFRYFQAEQSRVLFPPTRAQRPDLTAFQRLVANAILTLQFGGGHKLFNAFDTNRVAEMGVAKLGCANTLLLFLDTAPNLQSQPYCPFEVLIVPEYGNCVAVKVMSPRPPVSAY